MKGQIFRNPANGYEEPLVALIFKGCAILSGLFAGWHLLNQFSQVFSDNPAAGAAKAAQHFGLMMAYAGAGLSLWWMGEICGLLGRIARKLEEGNHAPSRESANNQPRRATVKSADVYKLD